MASDRSTLKAINEREKKRNWADLSASSNACDDEIASNWVKLSRITSSIHQLQRSVPLSFLLAVDWSKRASALTARIIEIEERERSSGRALDIQSRGNLSPAHSLALSSAKMRRKHLLIPACSIEICPTVRFPLARLLGQLGPGSIVFVNWLAGRPRQNERAREENNDNHSDRNCRR